MVLRPDDVRERLELLREMLERLEDVRSIPREEFRADVDLQDMTLRRLEVAVSCILDAGAHILAGAFGARPETYEPGNITSHVPRRFERPFRAW